MAKKKTTKKKTSKKFLLVNLVQRKRERRIVDKKRDAATINKIETLASTIVKQASLKKNQILKYQLAVLQI